jgi:hypothetical protein
MTPLLNESVSEIQKVTGCEAVGMRILDENGHIPYQAYTGFSKQFYEQENPLSIECDRCMCVNVIKGTTEDHGRRDYVFLYNKGKLEAVRKDWIKMKFGGMIFAQQFNLMHDPAERYAKNISYLTDTYGLNRMVEQHNKLIEKFPHTVKVPYQREPDEPYNPAKSLKYKPSKQVDW